MSNAMVTSMDDFYASLVADGLASRRRRPLAEVLAEDVAAYEPPHRFAPGLPAGGLLGDSAARSALTTLVRQVIKPGVLNRREDYHFDLEGDALLMSRQGWAQQVVRVTINPRSITVGSGMGVAETIIVRDAWDAGPLLTQAIIAVAAGYFVRGRRF